MYTKSHEHHAYPTINGGHAYPKSHVDHASQNVFKNGPLKLKIH